MTLPTASPTRRHLTVTGRVGGIAAGLDQPADAVLNGARPTVLHFIYGVGGGGAEAMMRGLVGTLDRRRWRVVVVAMQADAWPEEAESLRRKVDALHVLNETALLSGRALKKLRAVMQEERPNVVQTWMHHADFTGGLTARMCGVRQVVWGIHCREITRAPGESALKSWLFRRMMPLMARWVPASVVSCSQVALQDHARIGYPREKLAWIPNGINTHRFRPLPSAREETRQRLGLSADAPVLGFAGRFHEMKNLPLLLRAFALLAEKMPAARLLMCGVRETDLDEETRALVAVLPQPAAISWLPFQSDPEHFYPGLDVFTLSSRTEACPMTILEAMACGVPCVTTDVGDCSQLIGGTGAVTPAGDAESLASAWLSLLQMPAAQRAQLGAAARRRVVEEFSLECAAERYQKLYETLVPSMKA